MNNKLLVSIIIVLLALAMVVPAPAAKSNMVASMTQAEPESFQLVSNDEQGPLCCATDECRRQNPTVSPCVKAKPTPTPLPVPKYKNPPSRPLRPNQDPPVRSKPQWWLIPTNKA